MEKREVVFQFKGARDYVHGTDMFNCMLAGRDRSAISDIRFAVRGFVLNPCCDLIHTSDSDESSEIKREKAWCMYTEHGNTHYSALVERRNSSVAKRYVYDESQITSKTLLRKQSLVLEEKCDFTFIEIAVAMNKYLHQSLFEDEQGKWVFTRIDLARSCENQDGIEIAFEHNMSFRITRSAILVEGEKVGDIYFSLVRS